MYLAAAVNAYLASAQARGLSPHTLRAYRQDLASFLAFAGNRRAVDLRPEDIDQYAIALRELPAQTHGRPLSSHTVRKRIVTVQGLMRFLVERGTLEASPAGHLRPRVQPVDLDRKTIPLPDLTATLRYVSHMARNPARNLFVLVALADSGLRIGEVVRLRLRDVDAGNRLLHVRRSKVRKTQPVPCSAIFLWAYQHWLAARPRCDHDFLLTADRAPYAPVQAASLGNSIQYWTKRACGVSHGPHAIRHAWLSEALNRAGIPVKVAQDIAGHTRAEMTISYVRPDLEAQRQAVDAAPLLAAMFPEILQGQGEPDDAAIYVDVEVGGSAAARGF